MISLIFKGEQYSPLWTDLTWFSVQPLLHMWVPPLGYYGQCCCDRGGQVSSEMIKEVVFEQVQWPVLF